MTDGENEQGCYKESGDMTNVCKYDRQEVAKVEQMMRDDCTL